MADLSLPALPQRRFPQFLARLAGVLRGGRALPAPIDLAALSDHLQRDLGFRDGRPTPASSARAGGAERR